MFDHDDEGLRERICTLRKLREERKEATGRPARRALTKSERLQVLGKTDSRCHICGGEIEGRWDADHVLAHSGGGDHSVDNYLPAHGTCNNYRWDYLPEEFQLIVKLGVWARTEIEKGTRVGRSIESEFTKHEARRIARRKTKAA